jgi:hypothetical protein
MEKAPKEVVQRRWTAFGSAPGTSVLAYLMIYMGSWRLVSIEFAGNAM